MNKLLNTSFEKVIKALVPGFIRGPVMVKWLRVLAAPLAEIRDRLTEYRLKVNKSMIVTGQQLVLINYLNDLYDPAQRRIDIQDTGLVKQGYLFNIIEDIPEIFSYNLQEEPTEIAYVTNLTEMDTMADYQVLVPESVYVSNLENIRNIVNAYNILNRTFYIQSIEA